MITATLVRDDYRPQVPGVGELWLNAVFHIWLGMALATVVPLAILMRGQR